MKNVKRILVTGGAGFIASHVVDEYLAQGHQVLVIDNLSSGKLENLNSQAEFLQADVTDFKSISPAIALFQPQVINHHAAHILVDESVKNPQKDAKINILGLLNIVESAPKEKLQKIIMASTGGAIYGAKKTPFSERMNEQPLSPYGISKKAGELYLHYYFMQYGVPYIVLRYANVYGPRQSAHGESGVIAVFSDMMHKGKQPIINGDGTHTRDYIFISDVVNANLLALQKKYVGCINIGTQTEISTNDVFHILASFFDKDIKKMHGPDRPGEQVTSSLNCKRAKEILCWEPQVSFTEGIKKTIEWYKNL